MSGFSDAKPVQAAFWDERFARSVTPWDKGGVPLQLQQFCQAHAPQNTLIAGCGSAWEAGFLAGRGWPVHAIDFSAQAVARAQAHLGPWADCVSQADFFTWQSDTPLDLIYERAFLCALPRAMWPAIVTRWADLLADGGLLAGYFFFDTVLRGPPFGADPDHLKNLLEPLFEQLEDAAVPDSIPVFEGKERWQVWRKRSKNTRHAKAV